MRLEKLQRVINHQTLKYLILCKCGDLSVEICYDPFLPVFGFALLLSLSVVRYFMSSGDPPVFLARSTWLLFFLAQLPAHN